ncbi:MAG: prephenate dehydrogenase/arogenate dehydrogenase family protein [Candidatus Falkowbacteria bacterium]
MSKRINKTTIGLIGFGRFGTLLAAILGCDFKVVVLRRRGSVEELARAKQVGAEVVDLAIVATCDIVVLAVPISETETMIKQIAPLMKDGALLVDTCSVKVLPCRWLKKFVPKNIEIMGTHPMFGPVTSQFNLEVMSWHLAGLQTVLCPLRISDVKYKSIKKYLTDLQLEVIETTPEDHDRQNAKTLGLVHYLGRSLLAAGVSEQRIYTPGYLDLLKILPHTTSDNWQLFFDMNNFNPYADEMRERFIAGGLEIEEKVITSRSEDILEQKRALIDLYDQRITALLGRRFAVAKEIGILKKERGLPSTVTSREVEIITTLAKNSRLDKKFLTALYQVIFAESKRQQTQ